MATFERRVLDFLGTTLYNIPEPPPRTRDPSKPMQVICPGPSRSGTESLQTALTKLGYDTYHGWDVLFEQPCRYKSWCRLAKKKWYACGRPADGDHHLTREDFDQLVGHVDALTDVPANCFTAELLDAYPEAKVILNTRRDIDAWFKSADQNLVVEVNGSWLIYMTSWLSARSFWLWQVYQRLILRLTYRGTDESEGSFGRALRRNGKWIYREHCAMVRGLVPKENLLEWSVEDGWEPPCKFLGKEVPDEPFPNVNNPASFASKVDKYMKDEMATLKKNVGIIAALLVAGTGMLACWFV